jgi:hypothetical protein
MTDRFVVCKSRGIRIPCDSPLTAEVARRNLIDELKVEWSDVEIEYVKKARPLARPPQKS